jgi:uncharacterized protein (DUF1697 family)
MTAHGEAAVSRKQTSVALLRGINVGKKQLPMADLRAVFEALGCEDVTTYVQTGNVIFRTTKSDAELLAALERRLAKDHSLDVRVLLRTPKQLATVLAKNPFLEDGRDPAKLHVTFLAEKPDRTRIRDLDPSYGAPDELEVVGQEVYLHCPNGYGRTKLNNAFVERTLGVAATTRNWKTVTKLADLART